MHEAGIIATQKSLIPIVQIRLASFTCGDLCAISRDLGIDGRFKPGGSLRCGGARDGASVWPGTVACSERHLRPTGYSNSLTGLRKAHLAVIHSSNQGEPAAPRAVPGDSTRHDLSDAKIAATYEPVPPVPRIFPFGADAETDRIRPVS